MRGKRKILYTVCLLLLLPAAAFCQIRSYVGIVRESYHPIAITFLEKFRDSLKEEGYVSYAKIIDGYIKGGFGSGFVYVAQNGENYIVTNRHVVSQADKVSVEFETDDGIITKYENLYVLAIDEDIDIALLAFPDNQKPFTKGLTLYAGKVTEGQDIWSAGFPGLGNDPIWQLGKGNITNANTRIAELIDPAISTLIQHSAQLDSGNSGGPLMIASKTDTAGYSVIGINTWKAVNRQAANFTIPAPVIQSFIDRVLTKQNNTEDRIEFLTKRGTEFIHKLAEKDADFNAIVKYISYQYAASDGEEAFKEVVLKAPSSVKNTVVGAFANYSPMEGLRYAIAYGIEKKMRDSSGAISVTVDSVKKNDNDSYEIVFTGDTGKITSVWKEEHGLWRIVSFDNTEDKKTAAEKKESGIKICRIEGTFHTSIQAGYNPSITDNIPGTGFVEIYTKMFTDFLFVGGSFDIGNGSYFISDTNSRNKFTIFGLSPGVRLQLPLSFSWGIIVPYAKGTVSIAIAMGDNRESVNGIVFEGGFLAGSNFNTDYTFLFGIGYRYKSYQAFISDSPLQHSFQTGSEITLSAGIGWK